MEPNGASSFFQRERRRLFHANTCMAEWPNSESVSSKVCLSSTSQFKMDSLFDMESMDFEGGQQSKRATLVVDLATSLRTSPIKSCSTLDYLYWFPIRVILCGYFAHEKRVMFENYVSVLLLKIVWQDAMSRIFLLYLELRIRVYVDDMKLHPRGASMELPERLVHLFKAEMKKRRLELSVTKGNKEGKSKMEVSKSSSETKTLVVLQGETVGHGQEDYCIENQFDEAGWK